MMLGLILPLKMDARMYPSNISIPAVCFTDPRELYTYQELILGETLVVVPKTLLLPPLKLAVLCCNLTAP